MKAGIKIPGGQDLIHRWQRSSKPMPGYDEPILLEDFVQRVTTSTVDDNIAMAAMFGEEDYLQK